MFSKLFSAFPTSVIQCFADLKEKKKALSCIFLCSFLKERFKEAEEIYLAGIKKCPDSSDLHNNYGVFLVDTGEIKENLLR